MITKEECIRRGKHNSKVFTCAFPYGRYCYYCMTPIKEEVKMKKEEPVFKPIWDWNKVVELIDDLEERTTQMG